MNDANKKSRTTVNISATISAYLNSRVNAYLKENAANKHINRSMLVEMALENYLKKVECDVCHHLTDDERFCSYCGTRLDISESDRRAAEFLYFEQHPEHAPDKNSKNVVTVSLTDSQIRRLLNGEIVEQADAVIVDKTQYRKNILSYISDRRKKTKL